MKQPTDYHQLNCHSQMGRYEHEQGFSDEEKEPQIVVSSELAYESANILEKKKARVRIQEPRIKLKYISHEQAHRANMHNLIADKEFHNRNHVSKSLEFRKKEPTKPLPHLAPLFKSKRTLIGENMAIPPYALQDFKLLKQSIVSEGSVVAFEAAREVNTHGQIKRLTSYGQRNNFLNSKYNSLLKERLKDSFIAPKKKVEEGRTGENGLVFNNQIESGNLELVAQVDENEYDLYLRIDTNTHGHQNWFHFEVLNGRAQGSVRFNICNLKREFKLVEKGQRVFVREEGKDEKWQPAGTDITITENSNPRVANGRLYKLSFTLALKPNGKYSVAMLPAYTYSQMLNLVESLEEHRDCVEVELLGYSLTGLALPLLTITDKDVPAQDKKVVLVSCRIHPGESVSSLVAEGLMKALMDETSKPMGEMLKTTIFKIVPMLNPDGVVFGNFRTNYLGIDLNRAFHTEDEILHPEIWALKSLGRELKSQFGNNFSLFLDLHGHSSQKNIFSYGPNFEYNDPNFYTARLLPKVLGMRSKYFKYASCSFKLEEHKLRTARGFFLNELNVMTYTIESTYCLYDDLDATTKLMKVDDWINFGRELAEGLETSFRIKEANSIRSNRELRTILTNNENEEALMIKKIKSEVKKEGRHRPKIDEKGGSDSDGESEGEDLTEEERKETEKKVLQFNIPFSLPKVLKPAILYPTVTPRLFEVNEQRDESSFKILYTKRTKYNTLRMMNANSMYANYLKNLEELEKFKPSARNIKLEKKMQF